jgi:hypothetical protein
VSSRVVTAVDFFSVALLVIGVIDRADHVEPDEQRSVAFVGVPLV